MCRVSELHVRMPAMVISSTFRSSISATRPVTAWSTGPSPDTQPSEGCEVTEIPAESRVGTVPCGAPQGSAVLPAAPSVW